jgi:hypothetical protein
LQELSLIWNPYTNIENKIILLHEGTVTKTNCEKRYRMGDSKPKN